MAPRPSRTPYVLLGLLSTQSMTGYELRSAISRTIGHFWHESFGQIYPALATLERDRLVVSAPGPGTGRRQHPYTITDAGRAALAEWLAEPPQPDVPRNELLLKLFFGRFAAPDTVRAHLERTRASSEATAQQLTRLDAQLRHEEPEAPELPYWRITVDLGRRMAQARAEWAAASLATLDLEPGDGDDR